ncbi:hypothetical protein BDZ89DRAFT_1081487 [Hymenopellis radicata]|nr:hypothetical protein BDZ89DRAFT_1081487 [Hymenopellis radicata]
MTERPNDRRFRSKDCRLTDPPRLNQENKARDYMRGHIGTCCGDNILEHLVRHRRVFPDSAENMDESVVRNDGFVVVEKRMWEIGANVELIDMVDAINKRGGSGLRTLFEGGNQPFKGDARHDPSCSLQVRVVRDIELQADINGESLERSCEMVSERLVVFIELVGESVHDAFDISGRGVLGGRHNYNESRVENK